MLSRPEKLELYRKVALARMAEDKIAAEYHKDEMKTPMHLGVGAEAIGVGVTYCLPKTAKVFGTYRNHVLYLSLSEDTDTFFAELFGRATGCAKGKAGSMHMSIPEHGLVLTSAVVATTIPVAVGAAFANQYKGDSSPVAVFFGDGAIEEGVFWESLNFACLKKLKIIFVCEDNDLAIHTFKRDRQAFDMKEVVKGYDCHFASGDGRNVEDVVTKTRALLKAMDEDSRPGVLHFDYLRLLHHVGPGEDFAAGYRPRPTDIESAQDPLAVYASKLLTSGITRQELDVIHSTISKKLEQSVEKARLAPFADAKELYTDVFAGENRR